MHMSYDFSVLNDKEFEILARDILNRKFSLDLQDFKIGKDRGKDLRFSTPLNKDAVVVQAKNYSKSGTKKLLRDLKSEELPKVKEFKPDRYIIVTSVELSNQNKDELYNYFIPYILTPNDIFGKEDLTKYLAEYPDLETKCYKLWLSSTNILNSVLHNAILGRSAFAESKIRRMIQLYIHSKSYDDAFDILINHKYILITGQPGVGKTTLASLLTYYLLAQGHQLIYIDSDVKDAEHLYNPSPEVKKVFFFDDFLGANYLEILNPKTTESGFVNFLDRIKNSEGKYLILTTRTTIFRNALDKYEKMKRVKVDIARKEIELGQYSELDKAKILYNHLYHSNLSENSLKEIFSNKNYWKVIKHRNYNPRLIEFITDIKNFVTLENDMYMPFVLNNLENPEEVWRFAYEEQLTAEEKILLHSIFSQRSYTNIEITKLIFNHMLEYEVQNFNFRPNSNPFNNACRKLQDGIIKREINLQAKEETIDFINPSLHDFLNNYFLFNEEERWKLINSSCYIEQFEKYSQYYFNNYKVVRQDLNGETSKFATYILDKLPLISTYETLRHEKNRDEYLGIRAGALLNSLIHVDSHTTDRIESFCADIIIHYDYTKITYETRGYYLKIIKYRSWETPFIDFVDKNWEEIIYSLLSTCSQEEDFEEVTGMFSEYGYEYKTLLKKTDTYRKVQNVIAEYVDQETSDWIRNEESKIYSEDDWQGTKYEIKKRRKEIFEKFNLEDDSYSEIDFFTESKLTNLIEQNIDILNKKEENSLINRQGKKDQSKNEYEQEIEELFVGKYVSNTFIENSEDVPF